MERTEQLYTLLMHLGAQFLNWDVAKKDKINYNKFKHLILDYNDK